MSDSITGQQYQLHLKSKLTLRSSITLQIQLSLKPYKYLLKYQQTGFSIDTCT